MFEDYNQFSVLIMRMCVNLHGGFRGIRYT